MKTIYMDVTSLLNFNGITGIQRVVIEVALRLAAKENGKNYKLVLLGHNRDYNFSICSTERFIEKFLFNNRSVRDCRTGAALDIDHLAADSFWLDVDGVWTSMIPRWLLYPQLRKRNVQVGVYVHDVIVFSHPQFVSDDSLVRFPAYMGAVYDYADVIFTNTEFTKSEILRLAKKVGCARDIPCVIAVPGGDFSRSAKESAEDIDARAVEIAERGKYCLMVSTIEARKNHQVLMDAFDAGLAEMGYQMVFVGRPGWKVEKLLQRIDEHPLNGTQLHSLQHLNNETVQYLYENAKFVLFPSYIEGFGLATVEAMCYGTPAILSDVPVMKEVGGKYCDYFPADRPDKLIALIKKYEDEPELYRRKREDLKKYSPPTWSACVDAMLKFILNSRVPVGELPEVKQIVYLSARKDALLESLKYVEAYMDFIREVVVICPDRMAAELRGEYDGRLTMCCLSDDEVLNGAQLPEDHAFRNYFLRCLAMHRPEIDQSFIMSDDDYRPMRKITVDFYVEENRYNAYYFYDLDLWRNIVSDPTSYDMGMHRTNEFLKENSYTNLQFAAHMPQIIRKDWFRDMLAEHPGIESRGLCEWSTYFNYSISHHPEYFRVRPYVTLNWPGYVFDWKQMIFPADFAFENYYEELYEPGKIFGEMAPCFSEQTLMDNLKKKAIRKREEKRSLAGIQSWKAYENQFSSATRFMPSFVVEIDENGCPQMKNIPGEMYLRAGSCYYLKFNLMKHLEGGLKPFTEEFYIACSYDPDKTSEELRWAANYLHDGAATVAFETPGTCGEYELRFYGSFNKNEMYQLAVVKVKV